LLGKDEDVEEEPIKDLLNYENSRQHEVLIAELSNETMRSYVFETNDLCMFAGQQIDEER
jgi:hypothetical protein